MTVPARFACSLAGQCEVDEEHGYLEEAECQARCQPTSLPLELAYSVFRYISEEAIRLAPSDRVEAIYQVTGVVVAVDDSRTILHALVENNLEVLVRYPSLYHWLAENAYPEEYAFALQEAGTMAALQELGRLGYPITQDTLNLFLERASPEDIATHHELNLPNKP